MAVHDIKRNDSTHSHRRLYSIDLSLELERQLENESSPPSSALHQQSFNRQSLDPDVLASIVVQLRQSLAEVSEERDELRHRLTELRFQESCLKDALQDQTAKSTRAQDELETAKQKIRDDEEAIAMLRTKVEESRRGVMRLQSENRRMSQGPISLDMSRAGIPNFTGPSSNKRASFTPLTGTGAMRPSGHRRISSVSDSSLIAPDSLIDTNGPVSQVLTVPDTKHSTSSSRLISGLFRGSSHQLDHAADPASPEIVALRRELKSLKDELEEARHALSESNEAREASETCVKALREFIGENNVGGQSAVDSGSIKLPLPPTMTTGEEADSKRSNNGWRFKLWKMDTAIKHPSSNSPSPSPIQAPTPLAPISKKWGELFGSRTSISSASSQPLPTSREGMYHGSENSSIGESLAEPVSPTGGEVLGAGVIVRDSVSSSSEHDGNPDLLKGKAEL